MVLGSQSRRYSTVQAQAYESIDQDTVELSERTEQSMCVEHSLTDMERNAAACDDTACRLKKNPCRISGMGRL